MAPHWICQNPQWPEEFEHGISAAQYQAVAKVSKAAATRHLADLLEKGVLEKLEGGGRSTRYRIAGNPQN